jgi:hypothetical protein
MNIQSNQMLINVTGIKMICMNFRYFITFVVDTLIGTFNNFWILIYLNKFINSNENYKYELGFYGNPPLFKNFLY